MTRSWTMILGGALLLAGCGGGSGGSSSTNASGAGAASAPTASSVSVPAAYVGTWGADCSTPFVKFSDGMVHVFPDNADYVLKSATMGSNELTIGYDTKQGAVLETYEVEGDQMRLTHGTYAGQEATWDKAPMRKCS